MDGSKKGFVRARERHTNPRLDDPVALCNAADDGIVVRAIERVCNRTDEQLRHIARQHCVRVEGDDVPDELESAGVAHDCVKRTLSPTPQKLVELRKLS